MFDVFISFCLTDLYSRVGSSSRTGRIPKWTWAEDIVKGNTNSSR